MCCVVGYVGGGQGADIVLAGMERLEYRGYDSAGIAVVDTAGVVQACKVVGDVATLRLAWRGSCAEAEVGECAPIIGHTRWSTHGTVTVANAHPVSDCYGQCTVVHNGIIENEAELRDELVQSGHRCVSQTDSELIAHLSEAVYHEQGVRTPEGILQAVVARLKGAYAFAMVMPQFPGIILVARQRSPLCVIATERGMLVASDPIAAGMPSVSVQFLPDSTYAIVARDGVQAYSFAGDMCMLVTETVHLQWDMGAGKGYAHVMLQEMHEQAEVVADAMVRVESDLISAPWLEQVGRAPKFICIGSGTSYYAGLMLKYILEAIVGIPVEVIPASEARDVVKQSLEGAWVIALSQSGETADTLESMRFFMRQGLPSLAFTNVATSTMAREATAMLWLGVGAERAVASTKTFTAHGAVGYMLARALADMRGGVVRAQAHSSVELAMIALAENLAAAQAIIDHQIAPRIAEAQRAIFIGRKSGYIMAAEAALKLKEVAYCFTEVQYGGELKHGPLALVEAGLPVVVCSSLEPEVYRKLVANVQEVKARKGLVVAVAFVGQDELARIADEVLWVNPGDERVLASLTMVGILQYIAYRVAVIRGCPVDRPRNLAKSVTVE